MQNPILIGSRVVFDSEHGIQHGTVLGIERAAGYAVVEVDHALPGCTWKVPLADLQIEKKAA